MRIIYHARFIKELSKTPKKIQSVVKTKIHLFSNNPRHPLLRNHLLIGEYKGYRSINITGDWRAIYYESDSLTDKPSAIFLTLGTHSKLYK